jgi:hypothetical protein
MARPKKIIDAGFIQKPSKESDASGETQNFACMRYHETDEPRIFNAGESIPEGWNLNNRSLWSCDMMGKWMRRK